MAMGQEERQEQLGFFQEKTPTTRKEKCAAISIYRVSLVRDSRLHCYHKQIRSSADASTILHAFLADVDREYFVVLMLDQKNKVIGINTVSIGSLTASVVHPRECFKPAILSNAAAIILAHNHPSGQPQPSQEDRVLTVRLVAAGKLLGISVLDHVIIGDGTSAYFSFTDEGLIP
jgi:DNA repair protein RadC